MSADVLSLAATLTRIKRDERVSYAHIARVAGLTRNTVRLIATGSTHQPSDETLARIAVGLAADPHDRHIDQEKLVRYMRALGAASGRDDLAQTIVAGPLTVLLAVVTADLAAAAGWLRLLADLPGLDPGYVRRLVMAERARSAEP